MWQYGSPAKVLCSTSGWTRRRGPKQFLGNSMAAPDRRYAGYNHVVAEDGSRCCLAHARRKYVMRQGQSKDQESARIVALMDELFAIDREAREQNLDHEQRDMLRQSEPPDC